MFFQGSSCKFRHSEAVLESGSKASVCTYFANGSCQKGSECRFLHLSASSATSYLSGLKEKEHLHRGTTSSGSGVKGVSTSVNHGGLEKGSSSSSSSSANACYFFSIGKCTKGSLCPFQHVVAESALLNDPRSSLTIDFGGDLSSRKRSERERGAMDMDDDDEEEEDEDEDEGGVKKKINPSLTSRDSSFSYAIAAPSSSSPLSSNSGSALLAGKGREGELLLKSSGSLSSRQQHQHLLMSKLSSKKFSSSRETEKDDTSSAGGAASAPKPSKKFSSSLSASGLTPSSPPTIGGDGAVQTTSMSSMSSSSGATTRSRKSEILTALSTSSSLSLSSSSKLSNATLQLGGGGITNSKGKDTSA